MFLLFPIVIGSVSLALFAHGGLSLASPLTLTLLQAVLTHLFISPVGGTAYTSLDKGCFATLHGSS